MTLASEALFDGEPCAHAVQYYEEQRFSRKAREIARLPRIARPVDCTDAREFPEIAAAQAHLATMDEFKRLSLEAEWTT